MTGAPYGNRTRVFAVKGQRPRPLDEGRVKQMRAYRQLEALRQAGFAFYLRFLRTDLLGLRLKRAERLLNRDINA